MGMSGLDYTNQTPATDDAAAAAEDSSYGMPANTPKSKYLPTAAAGTALSPQQTNELLANMQRMIEQRTGAWNTMMGGIQDALAFTAPVANGQQALALQYRNEQKRKEAEELMAMQSSMASLVSGQNMYQNQLKMMNRLMGTDGDAGQQGGAGSADVVGGTPQNVGMGGNALNIPASARARIAMSPNPVAAMQEYLKTASTEDIKAARNPAWGAMTEVMGADGQLTSVPLYQAVEIAKMNPNNPRNRAVMKVASETPTPNPQASEGAGVNQFNVGNVRQPGQTTGFQQPKSYEEGIQIMDNNLQAYGKKGINTLRGVISRWSPPNENDTEALIKSASKRLGLNPDQPIDLTNPVQRQLIGSALMLQEKGPKQLFAQAPTGSRTDVPTQSSSMPQDIGNEPPKGRPNESPAAYKVRLKQWEDLQAQKQKGAGIESEESAKYASKLLAHGADATPLLEAARRIRKHAEEHPEDFNVASKGGWYGTAINAARVIGGETKAEDVKQGLKPYAMSQESISRQEKSQSDAVKLGIASTAELFAGIGARIGAQIESLGQQQKGVGIDMTAQTNILNAKLTELGLERAQKVAAAWPAWRDAHPGKSVYDMLLNSPTGKEINDWTEQQLKDRFPETGKPVTPQNAARAERERREAARKGQQ